MEPTSLSSKTQEASDINPLNAFSSSSKSQDPPDPPSHHPSSPSILSTVLLPPPSRMVRPDAFPSDRAKQILGLCWRNYLPPRTSPPTQFFYSYNYNTFTTNIRYRTFRNAFPFLVAFIFADAYASYRKQILKINLFDEYCYLRSQELVKQNEYLLDHPGTLALIQTSKNQFGGTRTSRRPSARSIGRPITIPAATTQIQNSSSRISSTDMSIPAALRPCTPTQRPCDYPYL